MGCDFICQTSPTLSTNVPSSHARDPKVFLGRNVRLLVKVGQKYGQYKRANKLASFHLNRNNSRVKFTLFGCSLPHFFFFKFPNFPNHFHVFFWWCCFIFCLGSIEFANAYKLNYLFEPQQFFQITISDQTPH